MQGINNQIISKRKTSIRNNFFLQSQSDTMLDNSHTATVNSRNSHMADNLLPQTTQVPATFATTKIQT
jgi:hypothetical protein